MDAERQLTHLYYKLPKSHLPLYNCECDSGSGKKPRNLLSHAYEISRFIGSFWFHSRNKKILRFSTGKAGILFRHITILHRILWVDVVRQPHWITLLRHFTMLSLIFRPQFNSDKNKTKFHPFVNQFRSIHSCIFSFIQLLSWKHNKR